MTYSYAEFDAIYVESRRRLTARIAACKTDKGRMEAWHRRHSLIINYGFHRHLWETERHVTFVCSCCGILAHDMFTYPLGVDMKARRLCFHCNHWLHGVLRHDRKRPLLIIGGSVYTDGGRQPAYTQFLGFSGHVFTYRMLDGTETVITNNMWHGGDVPEAFLHLYENNAEFVK